MSPERVNIGNSSLIGSGYEFGAGLVPSKFKGVTDLTVIDKRNHAELEALFGLPPPYDVMTYEAAKASNPRDFVTAHHVLEHCPDPIGALMTWLPLVRRAGTIFLSVPSQGNVCEQGRELTPIRHLIADHFFEANGADFESRSHIPSFVNQWASFDPSTVWYAGQDVRFYAEQMLAAQRQVEGHDIHWHTFSQDTLRQCLEIAAHLCGRAIGDVRETETGDELFITATVYKNRKTMPQDLADFISQAKKRLSAISGRAWL